MGWRQAGAPARLERCGDAVAYFAPLFAGRRREALRVLLLGEGNEVLGRAMAFGTAARVELPLRRIVRAALLRDARALIVAHNHPSGDPRPSDADLAATRALADAVRPLGIAVLDHLIFAGGEWISLRALGML